MVADRAGFVDNEPSLINGSPVTKPGRLRPCLVLLLLILGHIVHIRLLLHPYREFRRSILPFPFFLVAVRILELLFVIQSGVQGCRIVFRGVISLKK